MYSPVSEAVLAYTGGSFFFSCYSSVSALLIELAMRTLNLAMLSRRQEKEIQSGAKEKEKKCSDIFRSVYLPPHILIHFFDDFFSVFVVFPKKMKRESYDFF